MYKLMIVEDEDIVREGMVNLIDFSELGYRVVAVCENGREALESFYRVLPDVVLTDICMAEMDGFEFIGSVYSEQLHTKFIIISGHDDFDYMKKALKYKVTDYILKPVIARELRQLLTEVREKLDRELQELINLNSLKSESLRADFLRRQNFFNKIVGVKLEPSVIRAQGEEVGVKLAEENFCVLILDCPDREAAAAQHDLSRDLLNFMICNVAGELAAKEGQYNVFADYGGRTILLGEGGAGLMETVQRVGARTVGYFKETFGIRLAARVSDVLAGLAEINRAFEQASSLFLVECADELMAYPEWERKRAGVKFPAVLFSERLLDALSGEEADRARLESRAAEMFSGEILSSIDLDGLLSRVTVVANLLVEKFAAMDVEVSPFSAEGESVEGLRTGFFAWLDRVRSQITAQNSTKRNLMNRVFGCIESRYRDFEFSGEDVCRAVNISTSYFSSLFKAVTGTTFTKYLNAYRIDRAKELLRNTDKSVAEIGESVGYLSSAYFGLVFKNATGFSPNAYRRQVHGEGKGGRTQGR